MGIAAFWLPAAPASAGFLTFEESLVAGQEGTWLFAAADGEQNRLIVHTAAGRLIVEDGLAPITVLPVGGALSRCTPGSGSTRVAGADREPPGFDVRLGDGADSASLSGVHGTVEGGSGDDVLSTDAGLGLISGGEGNDTLTGRRGAIVLAGGRGADRLNGFGDDDTAFYLFESGQLDVDLRRRGAQRGIAAGDVLVGIENVLAGSGPSHLVGNGRDNSLSGGFGATVAVGGGGDDELRGSEASDRLYGGLGTDMLDGDAGDDYLSAADARRDTVNCGAGRDTARIDRFDRVIACERILRG